MLAIPPPAAAAPTLLFIPAVFTLRAAPLARAFALRFTPAFALLFARTLAPFFGLPLALFAPPRFPPCPLFPAFPFFLLFLDLIRPPLGAVYEAGI